MALELDFFEEMIEKPKGSPFDGTPSQANKRRPGKSKAKGNAYENKIAKLLGEWIFNDPHKLNRSLTSGAQKNAYLGDIVPQKQLRWDEWPFLIECKNGYVNNASDFNNTTLLDEWLTKCMSECNAEQSIIWLIVSFHGHQPLLFTNIELTIKANIIIKERHGNELVPFYCYKLRELIDYDFYYLYKNIPGLMNIFNV